ncbi:MAG TPA: TlpA disulfide reductase family protein [Cyclobacteriaceae bacterium]|nr:TlpA disulfide reductase family protein [Cyclobacteriaceae bacterium]
MRLFSSILLISVGIFVGCSSPSTELKIGTWRGVLKVQGQELPINFRVAKDTAGGYDVYLKNATEEILLDEVVFKNDSADFVLHVFDAELRVAIRGDSLNGFFILNYRNNYRIPFKAAFGQEYRFAPTSKEATATNFAGKYQVLFTNESDTTQAVGLIKQAGSYAEGSFLTPTGDYRFLEGGVFGDTLFLSTFDGNHTYLFKAYKQNDSTLRGDYWSGKTFHQVWTGIKKDNPTLPDPASLTYLKEGYERIEFAFPDVDSTIVRLTDDQFKNKVVILQIFGTWCPNCMDETKFLIPWYNQNKDRGVEILGLAYERKADFQYASDRVKKMIAKWNVPYRFVIAGINDKTKASETLPALNGITAFPTTIFIGKDGKVKHIHTGFEGPGTGIYHQQFIERFNQIVNACLSEQGEDRNF